ncbi:MAG TPA: class I SAM-dependent rRNA methyltransferase [bacterium]|nr:class I SAM-dependent rRNA methyltransferase [bacterium]
MNRIILHPDKDKLPRNHHPWVFSGAVKDIEGSPQTGEVIALHGADGRFVAYGHFNKDSKIQVRLLEWDESVSVNDDWYREKIKRAVALRAPILTEGVTDACRLIYSEADFLPGLIVDRFGEFAVLQSLSAGFDTVKERIAKMLMEECGLKGVYEKSDGDGRKMEGLPVRYGALAGKEPPEKVVIHENGHLFHVSPAGQKTGFYTDQRQNRLITSSYAAGKKVLDVCCYTGAFSVYAMAQGAASVTLCDTSEDAIEGAKRHLRLNNVPESKCRFICADGLQLLRDLQRDKNRYDLIVLDPPKFVAHPKDLEKGIRGYKDINLNAMKLLNPGGILASFSCSGAVTMELFRQQIAYAAKDAGREVRVLHHLHQADDHPVRVSVPETEYLKGLLCVVG